MATDDTETRLSRRTTLRTIAAAGSAAVGGAGLLGAAAPAAGARPGTTVADENGLVDSFTFVDDTSALRTGYTERKLVLSADLSYFGAVEDGRGIHSHTFYLTVTGMSLMREYGEDEWELLDPDASYVDHWHLLGNLDVAVEAPLFENNLYDRDSEDTYGIGPGPAPDVSLEPVRDYTIDQIEAKAVEKIGERVPGIGALIDAYQLYREIDDASSLPSDDPYGMSNDDRVTFDVPYATSLYNLKPPQATLGYEFKVDTGRDACAPVQVSIDSSVEIDGSERPASLAIDESVSLDPEDFVWMDDEERCDSSGGSGGYCSNGYCIW